MWYRSYRAKDGRKGWKLFCGILLFITLFLLSTDASPAILIFGLFSFIGVGGVVLGVVWVRLWEGIERKSEDSPRMLSQKPHIVEAEA